MKPLAFFFITALLCAGCAAVDERAESLLSQADAKLIAEDYSGAIASYAEFAAAQPDHAQAARARATQKALESLAASQVASQAAINRAQQGSDAARRELTERQGETDRLKAEIAKLRADLERLRNIDLQLAPKK
jgi:hypothetical protein